jgi:hypothetical protein
LYVRIIFMHNNTLLIKSNTLLVLISTKYRGKKMEFSSFVYVVKKRNMVRNQLTLVTSYALAY